MTKILPESQATQIKILLRKKKALLKDYYNLAPFKEPVVFLIRRTGTVDFFEKATKGEFSYIHSDETKRTIELDPGRKLRFPYGKDRFTGYILDEDNPFALPQTPLMTVQALNDTIQKLIRDFRSHEAKKWSGKGEYWFKILGGIALIVLAYGVYVTLKPAPPPANLVQTGTIGPDGTISLILMIPKFIHNWFKTKTIKG